MKNIFLICVMLGVAVVIAGCANQVTPGADTAEARARARGGLVEPGSVAGISSGTAGRMGGNRSIP